MGNWPISINGRAIDNDLFKIEDPSLTITGIMDAIRAGIELKRLHKIEHIDVCLVSPMARTIQTAYYMMKSYKEYGGSLSDVRIYRPAIEAWSHESDNQPTGYSSNYKSIGMVNPNNPLLKNKASEEDINTCNSIINKLANEYIKPTDLKTSVEKYNSQSTELLLKYIKKNRGFRVVPKELQYGQEGNPNTILKSFFHKSSDFADLRVNKTEKEIKTDWVESKESIEEYINKNYSNKTVVIVTHNGAINYLQYRLSGKSNNKTKNGEIIEWRTQELYSAANAVLDSKGDLNIF